MNHVWLLSPNFSQMLFHSRHPLIGGGTYIQAIEMKNIFLIILLLTACIGENFEKYDKVEKYDRHFRKYSKRYFGANFDWRHFKAQAVAESRLEKNAKSRRRAHGIMQIRRGTFKEIRKKNRDIKGKLLNPRWNIAAGIYYNQMLWQTWEAERPFLDRLCFMFGSYNAGKTNIINAQKAAEKKGLNPNLWESVVSVLPEITGKKSSEETICYVRKIHHIRKVLK